MQTADTEDMTEQPPPPPPEQPPGASPAGGRPEGQQWGMPPSPPLAGPAWGGQPPPGQPPYGPPPPERRSRFGRGCLFGCLGSLLLVVLVIVIVAVAVHSGSKPTPTSSGSTSPLSGSNNTAHPPTADVTVTSCTVDPTTNWPAAKLEITNHSSKTSNYTVQVEFLNPSGTRVADALGAATNVAPGERAIETAQSLDVVSGDVTCRVTSVERYASNG